MVKTIVNISLTPEDILQVLTESMLNVDTYNEFQRRCFSFAKEKYGDQKVAHCTNPHEKVYRGCSGKCQFFDTCNAEEKI